MMHPLPQKDKDIDISFFIPCYNEELHVIDTLEILKRTMSHRRDLRYEILLYDDASTDETVKKVEDFIRANPSLLLLLYKNITNQGLGHNYLKGAHLACGKYYMLINGDNDIPEASILKILERLGSSDIVIPYLENQKCRRLRRRLLSSTYTFLVNCISGNSIKYYNGQVLHLRKVITALNPNTSGFGYQSELICRAVKNGFSYSEVGMCSQNSLNDKTEAFTLRNFLSIAKTLYRIFLLRFSK